MQFNDVIKNNRLIIELENENLKQRRLRGMVLDVFEESEEFLIVDEFGNFEMIDNDKILSLEKVTMDTKITDALYDYKKYYTKKKKYEERLQRLKNQFPILQNRVLDAHFLTHFNIHGAKVRLKASIKEELLKFKANSLDYKVKIDNNLNDEVELIITVSNYFEYYEVDNVVLEKLKKTNMPDKIEELRSIFNQEVEEKESSLNHYSDDKYVAFKTYVVYIPMNEENFLDNKENIIESLKKMQRMIK